MAAMAKRTSIFVCTYVCASIQMPFSKYFVADSNKLYVTDLMSMHKRTSIRSLSRHLRPLPHALECCSRSRRITNDRERRVAGKTGIEVRLNVFRRDST